MDDISVTQLFARMDTHLARYDAYLARRDAELQVITETLTQQNARLQETTEMLRDVRRELEEARALRRGPVPDYDTAFEAWTRHQAAAIRVGAWDQVDRAHVAEAIEGLWKADLHALALLLLGFLELIYRPCAAEAGHDSWQSAVIDGHRGLLERCQRDARARVRGVLEAHLAAEYAWARRQLLGRRTAPLWEPPEACPWTLDQLLDEGWWPPEAPARLP
jgi:Domain of unknown function DUF29